MPQPDRPPPPTTRGQPWIDDLPGPAADEHESGWESAEVDMSSAAVPMVAELPVSTLDVAAGRRRLLSLVVVVLVAGLAVAGWRFAGWWGASPSSPRDTLAPIADIVAEDLDSEQIAFRERGRRRAAEEAASRQRYDEVVVGPFGSRYRAEQEPDHEVTSETEPPFVFEHPEPTDGAAGAAYAEALWREAIRLRQAGQFSELADVLDRLLAVAPRHRAARAWRSALPRMQRDQRRAAEKVVRDRLRRLEKALENRRVEALQALWAGGLDESTRAFVAGLFSQPSVRANLRPRWIEIEGRSQIRFGVSVTIEQRGDRGRRDVTIDRYDWSGRLEDGRFVGPFPG